MICHSQKEKLELSNHHNGYFVVPTSKKTDVFTVLAAADPVLESQICTSYYISTCLVKSQPSLLKQAIK
jgi:hypothetical protein